MTGHPTSDERSDDTAAVRQKLDEAEERAERIVARAETAHGRYGGKCGSEFCPVLRREIIRKIALALIGDETGA